MSGIAWDINQDKIVGVDPQLFYDIIAYYFRNVSSDIYESNTDSDDDNSAILDKLTSGKH